jgi:hypothetical protein
MEFGCDFKTAEEFWTDLCEKKSGYFARDNKKLNIDIFKNYLKEFYITLICRQHIQE